MGFFGTEASWFADLTLIVQTAGLLILLLGWKYAKTKNFLKHDKTAKTSIFLSSLSFIWMGFSLVSNLLSLISTTGLLILSHVIIGLLALFMGLFLVLGEINKTRMFMMVAFSSWAAAMFLGVILYYILFT